MLISILITREIVSINLSIVSIISKRTHYKNVFGNSTGKLKNMDKPKNTFNGDTIGIIPSKLVLSTFFYHLND
jgi:hypothetical protein